MRLDIAFPTNSVDVTTGTPSLLLNGLPFPTAIFNQVGQTWECSFPVGTIFPAGAVLTFEVSGVDIVDTPGFTNQPLAFNVSFVSAPPGEVFTDNTASATFDTTPTPPVTANAAPGTTLVQGQQVTLTGGGALTYSWDSASVQDGVAFTPPLGSTVYTVTGTDANGCTATSSITITVNQANGNWIAADESLSPSSPIPACSTLTVSGSFTWLSFDPYVNDNYNATLHYVLPSSVDINTGTPILKDLANSPIAGTNFTQTANGFDCTFDPGTQFAPGTKFIFEITGLEIADTPAFSNQQVTHYISFGTTPMGNTPSDDSATIAFSTLPAPTINLTTSPGTTVCAGDTVTLMSGIMGATSITWNGNPGSVDTTLAPAVAGTYVVVGTDAASGCSVTDSVTITVNTPLPMDSVVASPSAVCSGEDVTLQAYPGLAPPTAYCSSAASFSGDSKIDTVSFAGVTTGSPAVNETYTDNTAVTIPVTAGSSYPINVVNGDIAPSYYGPNELYVYIDYNQNLTFEPSELVYQASATATNPGSLPAGNITIPTGAFNGPTRMRVIVHELASYTQQPCGNYSYGETEDYTVVISGGATPVPPTPGFASISWTPNANLSPTTGDVVTAQAVTSMTTFVATGTDANGCTGVDSVTVSVIALPTVVATAASNPICEGDTAMLSATGADTFSWTPGALTGAMVNDVPTSSPTDYIVTGVDTTTGCSAMDTVTITFHDPSFVIASASVDSICAGDSVSLMAMDSIMPLAYCQSSFSNVNFEHITNVSYDAINNNSVGTTGGPVDYTAQVANVTVGTSDTLSVTIVADANDYIYAWIDWNQNGDFTDAGEQYTVASAVSTTGPHQLGITPPAGAINGNTRMRVMVDWNNSTPNSCRSATYGEAEDYTINVSGGTPPAPGPAYTYSWMPGSLAGANQTVNPTATTNYVVTQVNPNTGCEAMDSVEVFVRPTPTLAVSASPSATVCTGDTVTLMSGATGADSITWNGMMSASGDTTLAPAVAGMYTTWAIDTMSGCTAMDSIMVVVNTPLPMDSVVASAMTICEGDTVGLQAYPGIVASSYCTSNATSLLDTKIDTVSFAGVTVGTAPINGGETYTDNTGTIIPVAAGSTYPLTIVKGDRNGPTIYAAYAKVYIDYNQNNIFDASEEVYGFAAPNTLNSIPPTSITIPATAVTGQTRMRIVLREGGNATNTVSCGTYTYGETEDYTLDISGGAAAQPGFASIAWDPSASVSPGTGAQVSANGLTATTTFIATGTDANGCESSDSVTVMVNPNPTVTASASPATICPGDSSMLSATSPTATSFVWEPGTLSGANQTVNPTSQTAYTVTGTDANGCEATAMTTVDLHPAVNLTVSIDSLESCIGEMDGGATAMATTSASIIFFEGFVNATTSETAVPTPLLPGWTRSGTAASPRWEIDANGSSSTSTSPASGNNTPGYIFMETSSPASSGQTDTLISPSITMPSGTGMELKFFTHMYGADMGKLELFIDDGTTLTSLWSDSGQNQTAQADPWDSVVLNMDAYAGQTINLRYVGTRAGGFNGDMSLDDIEITQATSISYLWSTSDTTSSIDGIGAGTYTVTATSSTGCMAMDSAVLTQPVLSGDLTQATTGNTASNPGSQSDTLTQPNDGMMYSYFDSTCAIIASVQETAGGPDLGLVMAMATIEATVPVHNGQPFVPRWFQISPANPNNPGDVTLYVTQDDFDDYNTYATANSWPLLPVDSADATGIANLVITKNDDAGLGNNPLVLTPTSVTWDSPNQRWEVLFTTPGFSQFRLHTQNPLNAPLAVRYKSFTVTKQATSDLVEWTTLNENNNSHFNVQRSGDGSSFVNLGKVDTKAPNGTSTDELNYSFVDAEPQIGHNYYRLEQVTADNKTSYTEVIDIIWGAEGSVVTIYPNPTKNTLNVDLSTSRVSQTEVKLLDMSGRVVKTVMAQTIKGMNHIKLDISEVAAGVYGLQIFENNKLTHNSKVTKRD